ncbi:MAG: Tubulin-like protein CetZ [Candidatus Methanogasteraceae archaeon]|nr:MAG: Tubulin-like protein CetZ [ANME-2 cluster archaeon]
MVDENDSHEFLKVIIGIGGRGIEIVDMLARNTMETDELTTFVAIDTHSEPPSEVGGVLHDRVTYIPLYSPDETELKNKGITWCKKVYPKLGGAQRRREYGRACATYDRERVRGAIDEIIGKAQATRAANIEMRPIIVMVASMGGGTGSGANLEIVHLIKELQMPRNPAILSVLILPKEDEGEHLGNAFAAVLEYRKVIKGIMNGATDADILREGAVILVNPNIIGEWKDVDAQIMAFLDSIVRGRHAEFQNLIAGIHTDEGFALLIPAVVDIPYEYLDLYGVFIKKLFGNVGRKILSRENVDLDSAGMTGAMVKEYKEIVKKCEYAGKDDVRGSGDIIRMLKEISKYRKEIDKKPTLLKKITKDKRGEYFIRLFGSDRTKWKKIAQAFDDAMDILPGTLRSPYPIIEPLSRNQTFSELTLLPQMGYNTEEQLGLIRKGLIGMKDVVERHSGIDIPKTDSNALLSEVVDLLSGVKDGKNELRDYVRKIETITIKLSEIIEKIQKVTSIQFTKVFEEIENNPESVDRMKRISSIEDFLVEFEKMDAEKARRIVEEKVRLGINNLGHSFDTFYNHIVTNNLNYNFKEDSKLLVGVMKNIDEEKYPELKTLTNRINTSPFFNYRPETGGRGMRRSYYVYLTIGGLDIYHLTGWKEMANRYIEKLRREGFSPNSVHSWGLERNWWSLPGIYGELKEIGIAHLLDIEISDILTKKMDEMQKHPEQYLPFAIDMLDSRVTVFNNLVEELALADADEIGTHIPAAKEALIGLTNIYQTLSTIYSETENMTILSTFTDTESRMMSLVDSENILTKIIEDITEKNREIDDVSMMVALKRINEVESGVKGLVQDIQELKEKLMSNGIS